MNILFLIGNGFDKNLGLPTSYLEFYDYYLNKNSYQYMDDNIVKLHNNIKGNKGNWSDLEFGLGRYLVNVHDVGIANLLHKNLKFNLLEFLTNVTEGYTCNKNERDKFIQDLLFPERYLLNSDRDIIRDYMSDSNSIVNYLNIITFNYDSILERIIQIDQKPVRLNNNNLLNKIVHIHGTLEEGMILGLDNEEQIGNVSLLADSLIRNKYLKPYYCKICRDNRDIICRDLIMGADLFFIFGLSIGDTDKRWWQLIIERLIVSNKKLVLFWFDKDLKFSNQEVAERYEEEQRIKNIFFRHAILDNEIKENISENIIVKIVSPEDNEFLKVKIERSLQ